MAKLDWRLFGVEVPVLDEAAIQADMNDCGPNISTALHRAVAQQLDLPLEVIPVRSIVLVRRSLDARPRGRRRPGPAGEREVCWSHVVDVTLTAEQARGIKAQPGRIVPAAAERVQSGDVDGVDLRLPAHAARVVVIGAGPCGLFAALSLARAGHRVTLCERGKPVEERGRSIGALVKRGVIDSESNFCYGEGGAGTWSDGKLTTRIGRNSAEVRAVLETLVRFGAPARILLDGKPHLGTDNLVRLLKNFRGELLDLGVEIRWDSRVDRLLLSGDDGQAEGTRDADEAKGGVAHDDAGRTDGSRVTGVQLASGETLSADAVVLAAGHSARELYLELIRCGATLQVEAASFAPSPAMPPCLLPALLRGGSAPEAVPPPSHPTSQPSHCPAIP